MKDLFLFFNHSSIKYLIVGVSGYLVHLFLIIMQVELLDIEPILATFIAFFPVFILSYIVSYTWVFRSNSRHKYSLFRYSYTTLAGLALNLSIMYYTVYSLDWWYVHGQLAVFIIVGLHNYLFNRFWTFY
jgi:putative flippase GtrA